ncbi:MAG: hypothetical protein ABIO55_02035 [Ginsengibacter sp.]
MERVTTLIQKLQQQLTEKATPERLLLTVQMLYAELVSAKQTIATLNTEKVFVMMPAVFSAITENKLSNTTRPAEPEIAPEEKIIEILQVDEKEIEEELEEIKRIAEAKNKMSINAKPFLLFDPIEDVPTLTHQTPIYSAPKDINEAVSELPESVNEKLKKNKTELAEKLNEGPLKDLKRGIGINDRFLFINELFRGDEAMYERSIKTINNFSILAEAEYWIRRELKIKTGWSDADPFVRQFDQLVRRRFS